MRYFFGIVLLVHCLPTSPAAESVGFGRDVRPILARHCFSCHGPDENARESGLRLDTQSGSRSDLGGYAAVVPGDTDASELIARVITDDPDFRMPPTDGPTSLSRDEVEILRTWIEQGGEYETHWAFRPVRATKPPLIPNRRSAQDAAAALRSSWPRGPIDAFVVRSQQTQKLSPAPVATKLEWLRRVFLDLTATVPTTRQQQEFLLDDHPMARQRVIDRLLATPDFAETFATPWLDLARYADTNGYEKDRPRTAWPYRDWVLNAINADMPFDQFSIEQLAGDMLPHASESQKVATGFHRNTMLNEEGGIDPLEYRWLAVTDRVATTGTTWLGLTTGCAQCHTHKYDPITHTDYYRLFGLFNQADEPELELTSPDEQQVTGKLDHELHDLLTEQLLEKTGRHHAAFQRYVSDESVHANRTWVRLSPDKVESTMPILRVLPDGSVLASGDVRKRDTYKLSFRLPPSPVRIKAIKLEVLPHESLPAGGPGLAYYEGRRGDFFLSEIAASVEGRPLKLLHASSSYGKISVGSGKADAANVLDGDGSTGWSTADAEGEANRLVVEVGEIPTSSERLEIELLFERHFAAALGHFFVAVSYEDGPARATLLPNRDVDHAMIDWDVHEQENDRLFRPSNGDSDRTSEIRFDTKLLRRLVLTKPEYKDLRDLVNTHSSRASARTRAMVFRERSTANHRTTHRHHRGDYLQPTDVVEPNNISLFGTLEPEYPNNRLGLAQFLASRDNPLIGRVQVNRMWRQLFGQGLVKTAGDFGTQSEPPSHPELLDWLAKDWMDGGWSVKRTIRHIVHSSTYAQSVRAAPNSDPDHRLLSGFPYRRLNAESIRDSMLSAAGILTRQFGGPSVHPPQPASVSKLAYGSPNWPSSQGSDRFRKSVYTFRRRTAPFAAFATFDAPTGETCAARRDSSTNPLQALTLLNDDLFMEIAQALARDVLHEQRKSQQCDEISVPRTGDEIRLISGKIFERVLARAPDKNELETIEDFYRSTQDWNLVARAILNLDETITIP
ncbi:MAG: PSD1 and planctomycete cytochrome C domain-containing protein [Planctomycetota bacterium]